MFRPEIDDDAPGDAGVMGPRACWAAEVREINAKIEALRARRRSLLFALGVSEMSKPKAPTTKPARDHEDAVRKVAFGSAVKDKPAPKIERKG